MTEHVLTQANADLLMTNEVEGLQGEYKVISKGNWKRTGKSQTCEVVFSFKDVPYLLEVERVGNNPTEYVDEFELACPAVTEVTKGNVKTWEVKK